MYRLARFALACFFFPVSALADLHFGPYAAVQETYDSNIFALPSRAQAVVENGEPKRSDMILRTLGGGTADYTWSRESLEASAEGRHFNFEHFSRLDHDEYLLNSLLGWTATSILDGTVHFRQERSMALFSNLTSTQLTSQRERVGEGTANVELSPEWKIETGLRNHELSLPLAGTPDFALHENSASIAANYLNKRVVTGGKLEYLQGRYAGQGEADMFRQQTAAATLHYNVSGLSDLDADLGFTQRKGEGGADNVSGFTGSLGILRRLSAKTTVNMNIYRNLSSYPASANSELDTGVGLGALWNPTSKTSVMARYIWTVSSFHGLGTIGIPNQNRRDHYQASSLTFNYQVFDWLSVQPFGRYQNRSSNIALDGFNEATVGLELRVRLGAATQKESAIMSANAH